MHHVPRLMAQTRRMSEALDSTRAYPSDPAPADTTTACRLG